MESSPQDAHKRKEKKREKERRKKRYVTNNKRSGTSY
jgi:hypothetical protein